MITLQKSNQLKALAILMMLCLHLFNRPYEGLFRPLLFVRVQPVSYYISLFCDACVPIFCFVSGYGLYFTYLKNPMGYAVSNRRRILKLYITYWIILVLFAVGLGLLFQKVGFPGTFSRFALNFLGISSSYNGAWWFLFIYILLVAFSKLVFKLVSRVGSLFILAGSFVYYFIAFYFRVYQPEQFDSALLNWFQTELCLLGTSLLPFIFGIVALKAQWNSKISAFFARLRYKNGIALLGIFILIFLHGLVPNFIVAPFLALPFIFLFVQLDLPVFLDKTLHYLAPHATNMWLIHMFFYITYFEAFIYGAVYIVPIYLLLVLCSVISSFIVNKISTILFSKLKL